MPLRVADPTLWSNLPGVVAAYQPVAAPDPLSARWDMALGGRGRYTAAPGTAPTWATGAGWGFDGVATYLTTGISVYAPHWLTVIVRFSDLGSATPQSIFSTPTDSISLNVRWWGSVRFVHGGGSTSTGEQTAGVMAITGKGFYRDGVIDTAHTGVSAAASNLEIGHWTGSRQFHGNMQAFAVYERSLTDAEVWLASLQMKYCHANAAWNVWAPQRRWFFAPPPVPPAVATPVLSTIYINTADIGDTSLFDDVSGAAVSSAYARTGTNSFELDGSDHLQADLTSSATKYTKFGLLVTDTPASDALLCAWQESGTEHVSLYLTDKLTLQMRQGSTIIQTSPTTLDTDTWYCIEAKVVVHTTTGRFQVRIDGVDDMGSIGINTDANVDGAINEIRFEAPVDDTYIDDIVVREDQWCGTGGVYVISPTAAGTVEEWTGAYTDVDDLPPSFTDYITATAESGVDHVFRHGELAGDYDIGLVGIFAMGRLDSAAADSVFNGLARVGTTDHTGDAQDLDTIGVYARVLMTANPDGSVAWTTHAVNNALQIGVRT